MPESIADLLRASVENATEVEPLSIQLPVFDPPVTMTLRKIKDVKEREAAMAGLDKIRDETDRGLQALARMLVLACEHCAVTIDGTEHDLPKLGLPLWAYIYGEETSESPTNDVQAVFALYTDGQGEVDTVAIADAASEYAAWSKNAALQAHREAWGIQAGVSPASHITEMIGSLWHAGVGIDPGRLLDDADTAYHLVVHASYERFLELNARQAAEERSAAR